VISVILAAWLLQDPAAATVPALEFSGKPLAIPFSCTEETAQTAGLTCTEAEPCPVYVELASIDRAGERILVTGNLHSSASTYSSLLLASTDEGKTWIEAHERIPQAVIEGIQFLDFSSGWAAGQTLAQLPRDPFFLITTDGGKSWNRRPMFDETRVAAVDSFFFDSRNDGTMVLDRSRGGEVNAKYELYETKTGGDTWMLREVTAKPLKLKRTKAPLADLRLRADSATKSYRIEQMKSGRWQLLASFLIRLPDCAIRATELAPPPEPDPTPEAAPEPAKPKPAPSLKKKGR
jgi:photosystem II stability/assembly factor-like uncharacterized protein